MGEPAADITTLLRASTSGERRAMDALMAAVYEDIRRIAESQLRRERSDHTLQPTALANEAYMKLIDQRSTDWKDRAHFFAVASRIIRRILVDHARKKKTAKRGSGLGRIALDQVEMNLPNRDVDLVALDDALDELSALDERQTKIVEMRFFGGLTIPEVAEALGIGRRSVDREWKAAKAWLFVKLSEGGI